MFLGERNNLITQRNFFLDIERNAKIISVIFSFLNGMIFFVYIDSPARCSMK